MTDRGDSLSLARVIRSPWILPALGLYLAIRILTWWNAPYIEDHDSIWYLTDTHSIVEHGWAALAGLSPDTSPGYPVLAALLTGIVGDTETGARIASLLMSLVLVVVVLAMMCRVSDERHCLYALLLLALSPVLVRLSYAVLSEPTYIALVYAGWGVLLVGLCNPRWWQGLIAGALFGLAFLTRYEAVVYLLGVPLLFLVDWLVTRKHAGPAARRRWAWLAAFAATFVVLSAPQVTRVSGQLGEFSLNGRELWFELLHAPGPGSYEARIYGLDYSPALTNLAYLQQHPASRPQVDSSAALSALLERTFKNLSGFYHRQLGEMAGPLVLIFFVAGLLALVARGHSRWAAQCVAFVIVSIGAPLMGTALPRHLAIMLPCVLAVAGVGAGYLGEATARAFARDWGRVAAMLWMALALSFFMLELIRLNLRPDQLFAASDYRAPLEILRNTRESDAHPAMVASRDKYFTYYAGAVHVPIPYADYEELVRYLALNHVDYVFLEERALNGQPFLARFEQKVPPEFDLLYRGVDAWGRQLRLYRFDMERSGHTWSQ